MFYQEALPEFWFVSCVDSLLTIIGDRHWQKLAAMFKKSRITKFTPLKGAFSCGLMWGAYFCMGAYKCDVVIVMKMVPIIHGVLILCGCLLSRFCGSLHLHIYHVIEAHLTSPLTLLMSSPSSLFCFFFFLPPSSLVPRLLCRGGGKRAWYTLFSHAPSSLGNLHTTLLH